MTGRLDLPDFELETYFSRWEFTAEHHLTASDAESMSMSELLALGTDEERTAFDQLHLGYTTRWSPTSRRATPISSTAQHPTAGVLRSRGTSGHRVPPSSADVPSRRTACCCSPTPSIGPGCVDVPDDRFRIGIGRVDVPKCVEALERHLARRAH